MKSRCFTNTIIKLGFALAIVAGTASAQTPATLTDMGTTTPVPGASDIYQTNWSGGAVSPDGLNYYTDNANPPGQTFFTGANASGYVVTSLAIHTAGNGGQLPAAGQAYLLRFYSISAVSNATLVASYISATNFTFTETDWLQWTNLGLALAPNSQYAYSFGRISTGAGWENLATMAGSPTVSGSPSNGDVALIPPIGGAITLGSSATYVGTFDLGLNTGAGKAVADAPAFSPSTAVTVATIVTASATAAGGTPLSYQWQTDGGSGGSLTNISGATNASLTINTANWNPGPYQYAYVVSNASGVVTSAPTALGVTYPVAAAALIDAGSSILSGQFDISQFTGSGSGNGLNYYTDNGSSHGGVYTGQTFTTGTNSQGYYIDSVSVQTGGTGGSAGTTTAQEYHLFIYSMQNQTNATLLAHYTNGGFSYTFGDWIVWSNFSIVLKPNSQYAYALGRDTSGTGYAALNYSPTNAPGPYTNGVICLIPQNGGTITQGAGYSAAVFDVGLLPVGVGPSPVPFANLPSLSSGSVVSAGTQVTLGEIAAGQLPINYYWQTDGGSGTITNIPGNNSSNLVVNTTGWSPGVYQYDVIASNSFGFSKSSVVSLTVIYANTNGLLTDVGSAIPSIQSNDLAQPVFGNALSTGGSPDGLNYYFDNGSPPGQVFTTSNNPAGYVLTSVAFPLAGGSGGLPAANVGQGYILRIYKVTGPSATLLAVYNSETNFAFTDLDWLRWSGFAVPLAANTSYAYTFGRVTSGGGYDSLGCVSNSPPLYNGGACVISPTGGNITYSRSRDQDATFVLGFALPGYPIVSPPTFSPPAPYAGTTVAINSTVSGTGSFTYQWQTDGGSGGSLTNIPGATNLTLALNTTGMDGMIVRYDLVAVNGAGSTTSEVSQLTISSATSPFFTTDLTNSLHQSAVQLTTFVTGSVTLSDSSFQGTQPITYQWQGSATGSTFTNIPGQTNSSLVLSNLTVASSGYYMMVASNSVGGTPTSSAFLTVLPQPTAPFTVDFQWYSTIAASSYNVGAYGGQGVPGYGTGSYWNQLNGPATSAGGTFTSSPAISDDGITNRGITWWLSAGASWDWDSTPVIALLDAAATVYPNSPATFTFTLPDGLYNVVLFSDNGPESSTADSGSIITLNGATQTIYPTQDTNFALGNNYLVWRDIVVTNASLSGTVVDASGKNYGTLNGAQLQFLGPAVTVSAVSIGGGQLKITWSQGNLVQAPSLAGPWTPVSGSSPYTVTPTPGTPQMFYKVIVP
jgi:hypothetical protein